MNDYFTHNFTKWCTQRLLKHLCAINFSVWLLVCGVSVQLTGSKNGGVTLGGAAQSCEFGLNSHSHPPGWL